MNDEIERLKLIENRINDVITLLNDHRKDLTMVESALYMISLRSTIK